MLEIDSLLSTSLIGYLQNHIMTNRILAKQQTHGPLRAHHRAELWARGRTTHAWSLVGDDH